MEFANDSLEPTQQFPEPSHRSTLDDEAKVIIDTRRM
jgi:hypothetical protein